MYVYNYLFVTALLHISMFKRYSQGDSYYVW